MSRKLAAVLAIVAVLVLAAGLRIWGIGWGLPNDLHFFSYHPDETTILSAATVINFFDGKIDPGFYNYGSLFIYLSSLSILAGTIFGWINLPSGDIFSAAGEFGKLYMAGRIAAVALGIATVFLVYLLAKRAFDRKTGLLAALFMTVLPLHVMHSKFMAVDVPATFFVTLALLFAIRITDGNRLRDYLLAGLFAGLAAGTKYNAGLVILAPVAAHLASGKARPLLRPFSGKLLLALPIAAAAGFLTGTPGAVLNTDAFLNALKFEASHAATGHGLVFEGTGSGFVYHLTDTLAAGMGLPLLVLGIIGVLYALYRRTPADSALLTFAIIYYIVIGLAEVRFARYTMPLLPVLAVLGARVSVDLVRGLMSRGTVSKGLGYLTALIIALTVIGTCGYSAALDMVFTSPDTRDEAATWVSQRIPTGSSIGLPTVPWFYTPPFDPFFGLPTVEERCEQARLCPDYIFVFDEAREWCPHCLKRKAPDYVIMSEFEYVDRLRIGDKSAREYLGVLKQDYRLDRQFRSIVARYPWISGGIPLPHDMSYASPTIRVYVRKAEE